MNALIMGSIYDPDLDCWFVLMRVSSKGYAQFKAECADDGYNLE